MFATPVVRATTLCFPQPVYVQVGEVVAQSMAKLYLGLRLHNITAGKEEHLPLDNNSFRRS